MNSSSMASDEDYKAKADAQTLQDAEEIKSDPSRHKKAIVHLGNKRDTLVAAHANARRSLIKKVGKKAAQVFGDKYVADAQEDDE